MFSRETIFFTFFAQDARTFFICLGLPQAHTALRVTQTI
jgi:hypothetical protein